MAALDPTGGKRRTLNAGRLWAGGCATAVVVALIAVAGIVIARGIFEIEVLAPEGDGTWGDASTSWYAIGAALAAFAATGLAHLLVLTTPQPLRFFGWTIGLATVIGAVAPFASNASKESQVTTCVLNLILGIAIGSLVESVTRSAMHSSA